MIVAQPPPVIEHSTIKFTNQTHDVCVIFEYEALLLNLLFEIYMSNDHDLQIPFDRQYLEETRYEILFDHMDLLKNNSTCPHDYPMKSFPSKFLFHRPIASIRQCVEASGNVFVCSGCGRGHLCTEKECLSVEVCLWSARCRPYNLFHNKDIINEFGVVDQIPQEIIQLPNEQYFAYKSFDNLKLYYATRHLKKFSISLTEEERNHFHSIAQIVTRDLLMPPKKQSCITIKRKRKFYMESENDAINAPRLYLLHCQNNKLRPNWSECIRQFFLKLNHKNIHINTIRHPISLNKLNLIVDLICKILFKILQTKSGRLNKFDFQKMSVAILYCMATQGLCIEKHVIIPQVDWIRQYIVEQQELGLIYKKKYDKTLIIEGQNKFKQILRTLITKDGYNYIDFCII